ncbi:MAG: septum formation protein Maf [Oligoflexia bacterium]|nr:septum formation protein Maf [Oligoflexia bacterium]
MTDHDAGVKGRIVLASSSQWRRQLLLDAGLPCVVVAPDVDEDAIKGRSPVDTAVRRARAKARQVACRHPQALVLGADQVLWWADHGVDGGAVAETIGKPRDPADWLRRLRQLRTGRHELTTAVSLVAPPQLGGSDDFTVTTGVTLRSDLSQAELLAYVDFGEGAGCAGGYMVERRGAWLVDRIDGDWYNVVGLPVLHVVARLRARGWRLGADGRARPPA